MSNAERMLDLVARLNSHSRLQDLLPAVLEAALDLTAAGRAFLMARDSAGRLSLTAGRNCYRQDLAPAEFQGSHSILQRVLDTGQALYIPRLQESPEFSAAESVRLQNLQSAICIPLLRPAASTPQALGVLYIDSATGMPLLNQQHLDWLQALGTHAAICLENARLLADLEARNQEIEALNRQLSERVETQAGNLQEMKLLLRETQRELQPIYGLGNIVGGSAPMLAVYKILERVARTEATVMIEGESGTGKELVAHYVHYNGPRFERPMISVNCSAFNETLLESELFGHRKGSFTGAIGNKTGLFEVADGGTLFLDEVGDMSVEMQKKLLRALQDGEIRPVGAAQTMKVDVRVIAATNRNLREMVNQGQFREDLFYRLNVIAIRLPALRERMEDLPLLVDSLGHRICAKLKLPYGPPPREVMQKFLEHTWPGNVRELENELQKLYILQSDYTLETEARPDAGDLTMEAAERNAILRALEEAHGNRRKAAEMLGMPRSTFYLKLAHHRIM